jgi:hypothetical protein
MYEGRVAGTFETPRADDIDQIGLLMTGGAEPPGTEGTPSTAGTAGTAGSAV